MVGRVVRVRSGQAPALSVGQGAWGGEPRVAADALASGFHQYWALVLVPALLAGCGGGASPPSATPANVAATAPETAAIPSDVAALSFLLVPPHGPQTVRATNDAVQQGLVGAGYRVTTDATADVVLALNVALARERSFVTVNGRAPEHVTATLLVKASNQVIDEFRAEFTSKGGEVKVEDVASLVAALGRSNRLAQFAQTKKLSAEASRAQADAKSAESARVSEESYWNLAHVTACEMPTSLTACDNVRIYVAKYPSGVHVDEANKALASAQPKFEALQKDENTWTQAGAGPCRARATADACVGVELYVTKYPAGLHADEARALLSAK